MEIDREEEFLWLLVMPLLIPGILFGVQQWQSGQILSYESGDFKRELEGESSSQKAGLGAQSEGGKPADLCSLVYS